MQINREDPGHQRIATFDIETTHYKPHQGEVVSIGIATHDRDTALGDADITIRHRTPNRDEAQLIAESLDHLDDLDVDFLVSFNGRDFDVGFLRDRLELLGHDPREPTLHTPELHLDLLHDDRKDVADDLGKDWPGLEEALDAYGYDAGIQAWRGEELTNTRFGEELGPEYLNAVAEENAAEANDLSVVINEYLTDDLLKNLRLYYYDIGHLDANTT